MFWSIALHGLFLVNSAAAVGRRTTNMIEPDESGTISRSSGKGSKTTEPETCSSPNCPTFDFRDWTNRDGLGESPGIPNLEYLGLGYNIIEGNPRGSDISEADPGFRSGIIQLVQKQTELTIDQEYMVPLGVDVKYSTSCTFASKATELSSETQYRSEISREAKQSTEVNAGINFGLVSISAEYSFSESSKYKEFTESTVATEAVTYEARAMCSEFQASLKPYYDHNLENAFECALDQLSFPWNNTESQRAEYTTFFESFGTHYVTDVTLGAKHVFSSMILAEDVSELSKQEIDIETSLSWSVQASFGGGGQGNEEYGKLVRSEAEGEIEGIGMGKIYKYVFEEASVGGGVSRTEANRENREISTEARVRSRVMTVNELNVGGNPPEDGNWRTWATTVRDRPMPIAYEFSGIWNLITDEDKVRAFRDAIVELYNIDLRERKDEVILNSLRFGTAQNDGTAISSYNRDPSSNYRSNLQLNVRPARDVASVFTGNIVKSSDAALDVEDECSGGVAEFTAFEGTDTRGYFACGAAVYTKSGDQISGLEIIYCSRENWLIEQEEIPIRIDGDLRARRKCKIGEFISKIKVKADETTGDNSGIDGLRIVCVDEDNNEDEIVVYEDNCDTCGDTRFESERPGDDFFIVRARVRACNGLGILGLDLEYEQESSDGVGGPENSFYQYDVSREGVLNSVSAIFASGVRGDVGPNTQEDENELGFSLRSRTLGDEIFNIESYYPFGLVTAPLRTSVAIQDFKDMLSRENLYSFSFLTAMNLPAEAKYVAGVVHPGGYPANEIFSEPSDIGYRISKQDSREFLIKFPGWSGTNPTFLVFPLWFPGFSNEYPSCIGDIAVAARGCEQVAGGDDECLVVTGAINSRLASQFLGFSFIAFDGSLESDITFGIVHGIVTMNVDGITINQAESRFNGFNAEAIFSSTTTMMRSGPDNTVDISFVGFSGGILITFENAFRGLPSVIVSPIIGNMELDHVDIDEFSLPYGVVEHVTEESAFVKVNWVDTITATSSDAISFHIVAVGPQRDIFLPDMQ